MDLRRTLIPLSLMGFALGTPADVSIFVATPGSGGDVWTLNENQTAPPIIHPELTGIHLMPIDVVGRTALTRLLESQPQFRADLPEGTRVVLPSGRCLYRYRRDLNDGTSMFGIFSIEPDGHARPLGEILGTGPSAQSDPLNGRFALSGDSRALVLASTVEAGGDLFELDLDTAEWSLRTALLPPQEFQPDGLCLVASFGAAQTTSGLVRYERLPGAQGMLVGFSGPGAPPTWVGGGIVCSADATTIAFAAGAGPGAAYIYVAQATGNAVRASYTAQVIADIGFLPASTSGPRIALSPDGSIAAWIVEEADSRECFVVDTGVLAPAEIQLTRDQNFLDTLNDSGVIVFVSGDRMILVVGEDDEAAVPGLEAAEVFCVDLSDPNAPPVISNLSRTLNSIAPPFGYGRLETESGIFLLDTGEVLAHDPGDDLVSGRVISVSQAGPTTMFSNADELDWADNVGGHIFAKVQMSGPVPQFRLLDIDSVGSMSISNAPDLDRSRYAIRTQGGLLAAVMTNDLGGEFLGRVGVAGQGGMLLVTFPAVYGPTLGFSSSGSVAASVEHPSGAFFFVWPVTDPPHLLWPQPLPGFVLPSN